MLAGRGVWRTVTGNPTLNTDEGWIEWVTPPTGRTLDGVARRYRCDEIVAIEGPTP